jgi:hypothetical protein
MADPTVRVRVWAGAGLVPVLLLFLTVPLGAQEQGRFVVTKGADTLAVEVAERDSVELRGTLTRRQGRVGERVRYRATVLDDESAPLVDLSVWRIDDPEESPARQSVRVIFKDDSVAVDDELVTRRMAEGTAGDAIVPLFNLGGGQTVHGDVHRVAADSVTLTIGTLEYRLQVDGSGRILGGIVAGQDVKLSRSTGG